MSAPRPGQTVLNSRPLPGTTRFVQRHRADLAVAPVVILVRRMTLTEVKPVPTGLFAASFTEAMEREKERGAGHEEDEEAAA